MARMISGWRPWQPRIAVGSCQAFAALCTIFLGQSAPAQALRNDQIEHSIWNTSYEALGGGKVEAKVVLDGASGYYDIPGARGELSRIDYKFPSNVPGNATIQGNWSLGNTQGKFQFFVSGRAFSGAWQSGGRSGNWRGQFAGLLQTGTGGGAAAGGGANVVYGNWEYNGQKNYYYRKCSFPAGGHQYVIYFKNKPNWIFWYNPDKEVYWCECPTVNHPQWGQSVRNGKDLFLVATTKARNIEDCVFPDDNAGNFVNGKAIDKDGSEVSLGCPPPDLP
jgi:hypothetical protein